MRITKTLTLLIILSFFTINLFYPSCSAWSNGGYSSDPDNPDYGTHDWIAQHALDWLPSNEKQFILDNLNAYLYGTELPDNNQASDGIGDTGNHHVYYHSSGTLQADNSARRASEEFNKTLDYLKASNYPAAAKEAGIMSHYLADVGVFAHVMGTSTDWGAETHHSDYEDHVTNAMKSSTSAEFDSYLSFDGSLANKTAYSGALELARTSTFGDSQKVKACSWMDDNYNWSSSTFKDSAGGSLNYAVNLMADELHTLSLQAKYSGQPMAVSHLFVNEMEFNPAGADDGNEWAELYNPDAITIDLSGYYLINNDGDKATLSGSVPANGFWVKTFTSQYLDNTNEGLKLYDKTATMIDSTPIKDDSPSGSTNGDSNTWARCPDGSGNWVYQTGTYGSSNGCQNQKPNADFTVSPSSGYAKKTTFNVDASGSSDPDGNIVEYKWNWGDGSTSSGKTATHQYSNKNDYTIILTVKDDDGGTDTADKNVQVQDPPQTNPIAKFTVSSEAGTVNDTSFSVDASQSSDPDGDPLTYQWKWGDGATATGKTTSHKYSSIGTFIINLTVNDGTGRSNSITKTVTVSEIPNKNPVSAFTVKSIKGEKYSAFSVDASSSSDADGDLLVYTWIWGDGMTSTGKSATHEYSTAGTFTIKLNVSDGKGGFSEKSQAIEVKKIETVDDSAVWAVCAVLIILVIFIIICIFFAYRGYKKAKAKQKAHTNQTINEPKKHYKKVIKGRKH